MRDCSLAWAVKEVNPHTGPGERSPNLGTQGLMLSNTINPALSLEDSRLRRLPFEILGFSEVIAIHLPCDPTFSQSNHDRQLLLRLKWMFDAFHFAHFDKAKFRTLPTLGRTVALRLFLRLLRLCSSESIKDTSTADYLIWRYLALEAILSGMRVILFELEEFDQNEIDVFKEEIQRVATVWNRIYRLTSVEKILLEHILPSSRGYHCEDELLLQHMFPGAVEYMVANITSTVNAQPLEPGDFWKLYNTVSGAIYLLGMTTVDGVDSFSPTRALCVLNDTTNNLESSNLELGSVAIVENQLQRLAFAIGQIWSSSTGVEMQLDKHAARQLNRVVMHEMEAFQCWLLGNTADNSKINNCATRGIEENSSTVSLTSVQNNELDVLPSFACYRPSANPAVTPYTWETPTSQIQDPGDSDTIPPLPIPKQSRYDNSNASKQCPEETNYNLAAADEVDVDTPTVADQLRRESSVHMPSTLRRHETIVTKTMPSRKPLPLSPIQIFNENSRSETHTPTRLYVESKETLEAKAPSGQTFSVPPVNQRSSIRQTGLQLPVSTFTPASKSQNIQESMLFSYGENNRNETQPPLIVSQANMPGLEIAHHPPAHLQLATHRDGEQQLLTRGQKLAEVSEVHMLDPHPRDRKNDDSASIISRKKRHFFSLRSRSERPTPTPLPSSLELGFSSCGSHLILWSSKNATQIIRIRHPFRSGQRYTLDLPESMDGKTPNTGIRYLGSSGEAIVALVHINNLRRLYYIQSGGSQSFRELNEDTPTIRALALSPNGSMVALGCGEYSLVYRMADQYHSEPIKLPHSERPPREAIRAQKLNFSVDSQRLVSCIQVERASHKHDMYITIWTCSSRGIDLETQLNPVELSVGYMDDTGISSASLVSNPETRLGQHIFLTAALAKSYPAVLSLSQSTKHKHLNLTDTRIDSSAQCALPISNHLFAIRMIRSGQHKILRVDSRTGATEPIMQFAAERNSSKIRYEPVAIGMLGPDTVLAAWKSGDTGVIVRCHTIAAGKWETVSTDVADVYRQLTVL